MSSSKIDKICSYQVNHERIGHEPNTNEQIKFQRFDMRTKKKYLNNNVFEIFVYYIFSLYLCNFHIQMKMGMSNLSAPFSFKLVSKCKYNRVFHLQNLTRFKIDIFVFISL